MRRFLFACLVAAFIAPVAITQQRPYIPPPTPIVTPPTPIVTPLQPPVVTVPAVPTNIDIPSLPQIETPTVADSAVNAYATPFTIVEISLSSNGYVARIGTAAPIHSNDVARIMSAVEEHAGAGRVWINTSSMDSTRRAALRATIEQTNGGRDVRFTDGMEPIFSKTATRRYMTSVDTGWNSSGQYFERARIEVGNSLFGIAVICRVKAAAQAFMARLRSHFNGAPTTRSTMTIIDRVRRQVARDYNMSESELSVAISDQFRATRYVELRRRANVFVR